MLLEDKQTKKQEKQPPCNLRFPQQEISTQLSDQLPKFQLQQPGTYHATFMSTNLTHRSPQYPAQALQQFHHHMSGAPTLAQRVNFDLSTTYSVENGAWLPQTTNYF